MSRGPSVAERDVDLVVKLLSIEPLSRRELLEAMREERDISDSAMRVAVENARAAGHLVIHDGARYRLAAAPEEYAEWREREPLPRAHRLLEQVRRMDETAARTWPPQGRLWEAA